MLSCLWFGGGWAVCACFGGTSVSTLFLLFVCLFFFFVFLFFFSVVSFSTIDKVVAGEKL